MKHILLSIVWLFGGLFFQTALGQCVQYQLSSQGDTLNCIDKKGLKQGPWIVKTPEIRGNPGMEEEGRFVNDLREGVWRTFTLQGDVLSVQNYKWGLLDGKSQYYSILGLEREENWYAMNPKFPYDTFDVPDLYEDGKYNQVILKNEGRSLRHGTWTYYDPTTGFVKASEEYIRDSAVNPLSAFGITKKRESNPMDTTSSKKTVKPDIVKEWEKKNSGKKKVKVRDGSTGY